MTNWYREFQDMLTESVNEYSILVTEWKMGEGEDIDGEVEGEYYKSHHEVGSFDSIEAAKQRWTELCTKYGEPTKDTEVRIYKGDSAILEYRNGRWS